MPIVRLVWIGLLLGWGWNSAAARQVQFEATVSSTSVTVGQPLEVQFTYNERGQFIPPDFRGFRIVAGPNTSYRMEVINGRMRATHTISYVLLPLRAGTYTIGPAHLIVNGKRYSTKPIEITVRPEGQAAPSPPGAAAPPQETADTLPPPVFIKAVVSQWSPYEGQGVGISYYLYTRLNIQDYAVKKLPTFSDFYVYPVEKLKAVPGETTINGQPYRYVKVYEVVAFPLRSGKLKIPPLEMEAVALIPQRIVQRFRSPFDDFFADDPFFRQFFERFNQGWEDYSYQPELLKLKSRPLTLKVRPVPVTGKPYDFSGLVGHFSMESAIDSTVIHPGSSATITIRIGGEGNIQMIDLPPPDLPSGLAAYPAETEEKITVRDGVVQGHRTFRFTLEGQQPGQYTIPPFRFSYFDPESKAYRVLSTDTFVITVRGGTVADTTGKKPALPPKDIAFLQSEVKKWYRQEELRLPPEGALWYGTALGSGMLALLLLGWLRRRKERHGGIFISADRKVFLTFVKEAEKALAAGKSDRWGRTVARGFEWLFQRKLDIPPADLNTETLRHALATHLPEDTAGEIMTAWTTAQSEAVRPLLTESQRQRLWERIRRQWQHLYRIKTAPKQAG